MTPRRRFWHVAGAGAAFQAGSSAVDSATVMSALVHQLTGSPIAVGAVPTILRLGWLLPQIVVGYLAGKSGSSMPFYVLGAFGRTFAIAALAAILWLGGTAAWSFAALGTVTLVFWAVYAGLSGIVGVPYNDIVARSVPSELRSRMLAVRFFGGGVAALGVAAVADRLVRTLEMPLSYAAVLGLASALMLVSSIVFVSMGEPQRIAPVKASTSFLAYLSEGRQVFRDDPVFRRFVFAQWAGGAVLIAAPFYIVAASEIGIGLENVALLLAAQTAGALAANPLWGWWGDRLGKLSLMRGIAFARSVPPLALLGLLAMPMAEETRLTLLAAIFFVLGAIANGLTIAVIGLLMEISPDDRRPAYSGYFNALTAPAFVLPLIGGVLVAVGGIAAVFVVSFGAALMQIAALRNMKLNESDIRKETEKK
ncbi:MFS transporter [Mameliella alba]|uniref:MFS transporter n=1 Tax=Mameliella alba TaxID=561184 RepID=UPI0017ED701D|nr:MFS transporter [Mameliella alba]